MEHSLRLDAAKQKPFGTAMRIIFMGTPDFAVPSLDALVAAGHDIAAVYTQPPRPAGRGKALRPSPIQQRAEELGLPVRTPNSLRDPEAQTEFAALNADIAVVAAYGLILPQAILDAPKHGCINVHASLLPRWRGAAPIHRAILAGDSVTGVTIMQMEAGLDTGPMLATVELPIADKTGIALTEELAILGASRLIDVLANLPAFPPVPQPETGVTYATKLDKSETRLDFLTSATQVTRQIRAFAPNAYFEHQGERVRLLAANILSPLPPVGGATRKASGGGPATPGTVLDEALTIACNPGAIRPTSVQRAGRAVMTPADLLRGFSIPAGTKL
jgi:methionyl-tRNA formyltransferase